METITEQARRAGYEAGRSAGEWMFDGNSTAEGAQRILTGIEECDPEVMDMQPAPLSGEWAGHSIVELSGFYGFDLADEANADAFEDGYSEGYWEQVEMDARTILESVVGL